jgi:hypothetical protein
MSAICSSCLFRPRTLIYINYLLFHISRNLRQIRRFLTSLIGFFFRSGVQDSPDKRQREKNRREDEEAPDSETSGLGERWELTYYIG